MLPAGGITQGFHLPCGSYRFLHINPTISKITNLTPLQMFNLYSEYESLELGKCRKIPTLCK
ncbi:unnamed protein product, partial [Musa acuminata subsp. burmannicoides]